MDEDLCWTVEMSSIYKLPHNVSWRAQSTTELRVIGLRGIKGWDKPLFTSLFGFLKHWSEACSSGSWAVPYLLELTPANQQCLLRRGGDGGAVSIWTTDCTGDTDGVEKKGQSRLYCWRKLRSFRVSARCSDLLSVCCGEFSPICSHLLEEQHQRLKEPEQTKKKTGSVLEMMELMEQRRILHQWRTSWRTLNIL